MVRIALVGDPGAGGSTVLGLLYAAQVRWAASAASDFRFQVAPGSMARIGGLFERLQSGDFPEPSPVPVSPPTEFLFERHPSLSASVRGRWLPGRRAPSGPNRVVWTRASLADLRAHAATGGFPTDGARQLEGADVLAVLVPTRGNTAATAEPSPDDILSQTLSTGYRPGLGRATSSIDVVFIFTMLDRLSGARRAQVGLPASLAEAIRPADRDAIGRRMIQSALPNTWAVVGPDPPRNGSTTHRRRFFFSWLETDPAAGDRPRLRPSPGGGWEPAYPFGEYVELIHACADWAGGEP